MTDQEIIDYWTRKINVEQNEEDKKHMTQFGIILPQYEPEYCIPVSEFEILLKHNVQLTGRWSCISGIEAYRDYRRVLKCTFEMVSEGTPIPGYYKVVGEDKDNYICNYSSEETDVFVSQTIGIHKYQLFAPTSQGNRRFINVGDVFHVESIDLVEVAPNKKRYAIKWQVI